MADEQEQLDQQDNENEKTERRTIDKLHLVNFTAFKDLEMEFSPGINAIIGENATGKTHVLKVLYAGSRHSEYKVKDRHMGILLWSLLSSALKPAMGNNKSLLYKHRNVHAAIDIHHSNGSKPHYELMPDALFGEGSHPMEGYTGTGEVQEYNSCFIPANEFLSHARDFKATYDKKLLHFDLTYYHLSDKVFDLWERKLDKQAQDVLAKIWSATGRSLEVDQLDFYLDDGEIRVEIPLSALGHCKLATLEILLLTNNIKRNSILLWDEPEANFNPKLMKKVVEIMLMLEEMGVQIFFATHDYVVLKWLDLLAKPENHVKYHALYHRTLGDIHCESSDDLLKIENNAILDTYSEIYKAELARTRDRIGNG
jgi:predicted ATPase